VLKLIVKYTIQKHKQLGEYVVWQETKTEHGYGNKRIFKGTKQECQEYLEKLKGE
jgi:hypothetical protein